MKTNRRKLLKGSLAAPMIFTLGPATSWAQAVNSAGVCLQKSDLQITDTNGAVVSSEGADEFVRVPINLLQLTQTVEGQENPVTLDGTYIRSFNNQTYLRVVLGSPDPPFAAEPPLQVGAEGLSEQVVGSGQALVRVAKLDPNANAEITGFAWEGGLGAIASIACATASAGLALNGNAASILRAG